MAAADPVVWRDFVGRTGPGRLRSRDADVVLEVGGGAPADGFLTLEFTSYARRVVVECESFGSEANERVLGGAMKARVTEQRATVRHPVSEPPSTLRWVEFDEAGTRSRSATILDFSVGGARASTPSRPPAEPFAAEFEVGDTRIECMVDLRSAVPRGAEYELGLAFLERPAPLVEAYLRARFPPLRPRRELPAQAMYELLRRSGYLDLRADCEPTAPWYSVDADAVTRDVAYVDGAIGPIGHVSLTRTHRRSWMGHQIAIRRDVPESWEARRLLYLYFASVPTALDGESTYLYGFFNRARPWHQRYFETFVRWVDDPQLADIQMLDRFELTQPPGTAPATKFRVTAADRSELAEITNLVRASVSPLFADALDIVPEWVESQLLHEGYRSAAFERARTALVLRDRDRMVGVALCETGSRDLSLFNVFNVAYVFMTPAMRGREAAGHALLQHELRRFYADRGVRTPLVVAPPDHFLGEALPGVARAETMGAIAWSGKALVLYETFVALEAGRVGDERRRVLRLG